MRDKIRISVVKADEVVVTVKVVEAEEMEMEGGVVMMVRVDEEAGMVKVEGEVEMVVAKIINNRGAVAGRTEVEHKAEVAIVMTTRGNRLTRIQSTHPRILWKWTMTTKIQVTQTKMTIIINQRHLKETVVEDADKEVKVAEAREEDVVVAVEEEETLKSHINSTTRKS